MTARGILEADRVELRRRLREEAQSEADNYLGWLEELGCVRVIGVPSARRVRHGGAGHIVYGRGGEHDELPGLAATDRARLYRNGWLETAGAADRLAADVRAGRKDSSAILEREAGVTADEMVDRMADRGYADGWDEWLRVTRIVDACKAVAAGRRPGRWADDSGFAWWSHVAPTLEADGYDVRDILAGYDPDEADEARPAVVVVETGTSTPAGASDRLAAYLGRLVHGPKVDYASALAAALLQGTATPEEPAAEWGPKVTAKVTRLCASSRRVAA